MDTTPRDQASTLAGTALLTEMILFPGYLYAYYSISDINSEAHQTLSGIVTHKMQRLGLSANLFIAVGGQPQFNVVRSKGGLLPESPVNRLPSEVSGYPEMEIHLHPFDREQKNLISKIEEKLGTFYAKKVRPAFNLLKDKADFTNLHNQLTNPDQPDEINLAYNQESALHWIDVLSQQNQTNAASVKTLSIPDLHPVVRDPQTDKTYELGSDAHTHSTYFNSYYSYMIDKLQSAFGDGGGGTLSGDLLKFAISNYLAVYTELLDATLAMLPLYRIIGLPLPMGVSQPPSEVSSMILEAAGNPKSLAHPKSTVVVDGYTYAGLIRTRVREDQPATAGPTFEYLGTQKRSFPPAQLANL